MKRLIFFIFTAILFGSCVSMPPDYQEQVVGEHSPKELEMIRQFNQEPQYFKKSKIPTADEVNEMIDESVSSPSDCVEGVSADEINSGLNVPAADNKNLSSLDVPNPEEVLKPLGPIPDPGGRVNFELPDPGTENTKILTAGYYRYSDEDRKVFGTARTVWRLQAAGKILAKKGIAMAVGDMSSRGGRTSGHAEHQGGNDVDLRLVGKRGVGNACTVNNSSCYDREKTFEMIKTLIDMDPGQFDKVLINDSTLRAQINSYAREKYGIRNAARSCKGHDNHVHFSWKGG